MLISYHINVFDPIGMSPLRLGTERSAKFWRDQLGHGPRITIKWGPLPNPS